MKKLFLSLLVALFASATAMAGDDIKLTSGSIAELKAGGTGSVVLDIKDTKFDGKKDVRKDERFANIDSWMEDITSEFVREFNDNSKKFVMTENADDAQYKFIVKITNLDVFINVMSFKGGVGIKLWGTITILNKSGDTVAVYEIDEESNSGITYQIATEEGFEGIAEFLAKRINKGK